MNKELRCLPIGDLPYTSEKAVLTMMIKLFEHLPYLVNLPAVSPHENLLERTLTHIPGIELQGKRVRFLDEGENLQKQLAPLDAAFNNPTSENLKPYGFDAFFLPKYFQILERIQPKNTVVNLLGPFSVAQSLSTNSMQALCDKYYRKLIIQAVSLKALWIINKIKEVSPKTKPVVIFEEPLLYRAGDIKRKNEDITQELIINFMNKVISKVQSAGATVCIQSFEKCDWQIPIDAGANIISFDAFKNPNNLNIIPDKVNEFLANGGRINWAIVPTATESAIKQLSTETAYDLFIKTVENLISAGTSERLTYNNSSVSVQGNLNHLPLIFAEKALIIVTQLAKKIPVKS